MMYMIKSDSEHVMKKKLSLDAQIQDMKGKGIRFELCSEEEAKKILAYNTYYFKIKAYEKNYNNDNREHKFTNLDFKHLMELSKIDMYLRKMILEMSLDIEHVLKTRLIYDCTINSDTDGYDFVREYLDENYSVEKSIIYKSKGKSFCASLAKRYCDLETNSLRPIPIWTIVELISFGDFINLYTFYYQKYKRVSDYSRYLGAVKFLRNAAAHSNCFIYSLKKLEGFSKTAEVMNSISRAKNITNKTRLNKMSIPVVHDFVTLLLVYNDLLNTPQNRNMKKRRMEEVAFLFLSENGRIKRDAYLFSGNAALKESYMFICDVLKYIENMENKPGFNRLLKTN